ncbi:MAG: ABC transporter ATP-binding protein [Proteobacteria bacterium]|nr:ABC transporter ATP-binding protein [Pseudomonadota bacterium]
MRIDSGGIKGLLGRNGAGKTTLLKLIAGLLFPQQGSCEIFGKSSSLRAPATLRNIYFIPEEFQLPAIKIGKYQKLYSPFYPLFDQESFRMYLKEFSLDPELKLEQLSFGQKKKFLISFALATSCQLVLMDEPTNGLDIPSKGQFRKVLSSTSLEERCFIISTHQVRDIEQLLDSVLILDEGTLLLDQSLDRLKEKLLLTHQKELPQGDESIYYEEERGGYLILSENHSEKKSEMDLELLFNSLINQPQKFKKLFKSGESFDQSR